MSTYVATHLGGVPAGGAAFMRRRRAAAVLHLLPHLRRPAEAARPAATGTLVSCTRPSNEAAALAFDAWTPLAHHTRYSP